MPFTKQIVDYINDQLKGGSLNKKELQPASFFNLTTPVLRAKQGTKETSKLEQLPAAIDGNSKIVFIVPENKQALQIYHKLLTKSYGFDKGGYGNDRMIKATSDVSMVVIANSKITGIAQAALETVILFGLPDKISSALTAELKIRNCLITPVGANMDTLQVFRQEYPQSEYFLNEKLSMFSIRYKIEITFNKNCVEQCLCENS